MARSMTSPETAAAWRVLRRFVAEANRRPPHLALDSLLTIAEWMEVEQGGAADRVPGARSQLSANVVDSEIVPRWLSQADETRYAGGYIVGRSCISARPRPCASG